MRSFSIPGIKGDFFQHEHSQSVSSDGYEFYKVIVGMARDKRTETRDKRSETRDKPPQPVRLNHHRGNFFLHRDFHEVILRAIPQATYLLNRETTEYVFLYHSNNSFSVHSLKNSVLKKRKNSVHSVPSLKNSVLKKRKNSVLKKEVIGKRVLDLGTGNGILLLMLCKDFPEYSYTGVELIPDLAELARLNFETLSVSMGQKLGYRIMEGDYCKLSEIFSDQEKFDLIISNPPYFPVGMGKISSVYEKAVSRFEIVGDLAGLLKSVKNYLSEEGVCYLMYPEFRREEVESLSSELSLTAKKIRPKNDTQKEFLQGMPCKNCKPEKKFLQGMPCKNCKPEKKFLQGMPCKNCKPEKEFLQGMPCKDSKISNKTRLIFEIRHAKD